LFGCIALLNISPIYSQQPVQRRIERVEGYLATPEPLEFNKSLVQQLRIPAGFLINVFTKDLGNPRNIAIAPDGTVYVTRREEQDVIALRDRNRDGRADEMRMIASNLPFVNGITIYQNRLYYVTDTSLYASDLGRNGAVGKPQVLIIV